MRIVTYCATYLPGYKAGGPLRTIAGLVKRLPELEFWVVARDRDVGDTKPYDGVELSTWTTYEGAHVYYASARDLTPRALSRIVTAARPDLHYVNSFFSPLFGVVPVLLRRALLLPAVPTIVAPRGEFSPGALAIKGRKKAAFLKVARASGAWANVTWQASAANEADDIRREFPRAHVMIAGDLTDPPRPPSDSARPPKRPGAASFAYVSRITPKKNLALALRLLGRVRGDVEYHVYGPPDDAAYSAECRTIAAALPANVRVTFHGDVPHAVVTKELARHHAFLMPTMGENFGHAILEAMLAGCVTIIGDATPWRGLADKGAGWDLPVADEEAFLRAMQATIDMDAAAFARASAAAREVGVERAASEEIVEQNRVLFRSAAAAGAA